MKKKYRDITINDIKYKWVVKPLEECLSLSIYKNGKLKHEQLLSYMFHKPITPKYIRELILTKVKNK